jgi:hypothetical protein
MSNYFGLGCKKCHAYAADVDWNRGDEDLGECVRDRKLLIELLDKGWDIDRLGTPSRYFTLHGGMVRFMKEHDSCDQFIAKSEYGDEVPLG